MSAQPARASTATSSLRCTLLQVGDKVVNVSASFGTDIWDAKNYGQVLRCAALVWLLSSCCPGMPEPWVRLQVLYAIKTRNGDVFLRFQKMYGNMSALQVSTAACHACVASLPAAPSTSHHSMRILATSAVAAAA